MISSQDHHGATCWRGRGPFVVLHEVQDLAQDFVHDLRLSVFHVERVRPAFVHAPSRRPHVGAEGARQPIGGRVVEQDLKAVAVGLGGRLATDRSRDRLL